MDLDEALKEIYSGIANDTAYLAESFNVDDVDYTGVVNSVDLEDEEQTQGAYVVKYNVFMDEGLLVVEIDQEVKFNGDMGKIIEADNDSRYTSFTVVIFKV